jgi:hypothetical protein
LAASSEAARARSTVVSRSCRDPGYRLTVDAVGVEAVGLEV